MMESSKIILDEIQHSIFVYCKQNTFLQPSDVYEQIYSQVKYNHSFMHYALHW